jgi:hypothetical protein
VSSLNPSPLIVAKTVRLLERPWPLFLGNEDFAETGLSLTRPRE